MGGGDGERDGYVCLWVRVRAYDLGGKSMDEGTRDIGLGEPPSCAAEGDEEEIAAVLGRAVTGA
jgi:hypothetical protein